MGNYESPWSPYMTCYWKIPFINPPKEERLLAGIIERQNLMAQNTLLGMVSQGGKCQ
jgi:hypothetical protein